MSASYHVYISKSVRKSMLRIPLPWIERIEMAIDHLQNDPFYGEKMSGVLADCRKVRVWPYRILYKVDKIKKEIWIVEVGHRGGMSYK